MIDGVHTKTLRQIPDERGTLMEMLRCDDDIFEGFGQAYITTCYPGVVKAWHYHKKQIDNFVCVAGLVKIVLYDTRTDSATHGELNEFYLGRLNPILLQIPRDVYHGFMACGGQEAAIINIPSEPYVRDDPDEYRLPWNDPSVPYDWAVKNG